MKILICDFEGTTFNGRDKETKVWLSCISDFDMSDHYIIGNSIEDFMNSILENECANVLFHNLGGYDAHFIFSWLNGNGYHRVTKTDVPRPTEDDNAKLLKKGLPKKDWLEKFFIGDSKSFTVFDGDKMFNFFDTLKVLDGSLSEIAKTVGLKKGKTPLVKHPKKEKVTQFSKLTTKGHLIKGVYPKQKIALPGGGEKRYLYSIKEHIITDDDIEYIKMDTRILKVALKKFRLVECIENRMYSISNIAYQTALSEKPHLEVERIEEFEPFNKYKGYKQLYREKRYSKIQIGNVVTARQPEGLEFKTKRRTRKHIEEIEAYIDHFETLITEGRYQNEDEKSYFEQILDKLHTYKSVQIQMMRRNLTNNYCRESYRGGLVYPNPRYQNKWIEGIGITIDVNSRHTSNYTTQKLPMECVGVVDSVEEFTNKFNPNQFVYFIRFDRLKASVKKGKVPIIKIREDDLGNKSTLEDAVKAKKYQDSIDYKNLILTQIDFEYMLQNYEIKEALNTRLFVFNLHEKLMKKLSKHGEFWYNEKCISKENGDTFSYFQSKAMLNKVVGYLGVNPDSQKNMGHGGRSTQSNVAAASFINAYARVQMAEVINNIGLEYYLYGDTDSIHLLLPPKCLTNGDYDEAKTIEYLKTVGVEVDEYKLGAWKIERVFRKSKFIGTRTYGELSIDGDWHSVVAGYKEQIPMERFKVGEKLSHLMRHTVEGGTLLLPTEFTIESL